MIESPLQPALDSRWLQKTFYPLGFPLVISSNSENVLQAADAEFGPWTQAFDEPPLNLRVEVSEGDGELPPATEFHAHRHLFAYVANSRNFAVCDTSARDGNIWITTAAAEDAAYFHYHFLDGIVSMLIESPYLTPVHAACVARDNRGVLLCGDSGAGKSTLAYACARRGWTYVTDDGSYLIRRRAAERLVVANSHRMRLRPDSVRMFPELAGHRAALRGNGKWTLELWTRDLGAIHANPTARVDRFVFLQRKSNGAARLTDFDKPEALSWCDRVFFHWDPAVAGEQQSTISALLDAIEIQALEYSNIEDAVDALER